MKNLLLLGTTLLSFLPSVLRAQTSLDAFNPNTNGTVLAIALQPDGKIIIGGNFTNVSPNGGPAVARNRLARLNPDGTFDLTFDPSANAEIRALVLQPDGKIVAGGLFTTLSPNGAAAVTRNRVARLNADGTLDMAFDANVNIAVDCLALQADGKVLVGGLFTNVGVEARNRIARLDAVTGVPDAFNPNADNRVTAIAVQSDGRILAGGIFTSIGGQTRNRIARLDAGTGAADSYNPDA